MDSTGHDSDRRSFLSASLLLLGSTLLVPSRWRAAPPGY
jgi:hypothetical protein